MTTRRAADNSKALDAFIAAKAEIDTMLVRLKALSDDHFETHPDEIHWGHVGTLNHYRAKLREITDMAPMDLVGARLEMVRAEGGEPLQHRVDLGLRCYEGVEGFLVGGGAAGHSGGSVVSCIASLETRSLCP